MKRILSWILLVVMIFSLCACGGDAAPEGTTAAPTEASAVEATETEEVAATEAVETEPAVLEGSLYLKVSSVTFSLVGETDDIYLGMIPRELIRWESDDPSVVSVENGVLTATGVGTTTIRAIYEDRQVECTAGCLAETQDELDSLDREILAAPKRLPPVFDVEQPCTIFDNSAILGDSITWVLLQNESKNNYLGNIVFLTRGGISLNSLIRHSANIYYQGQELYIENAVEKAGVEQLLILLGSNDINDVSQSTYVFENWSTLVERVRGKSPNVQITIMSQIPCYDDGHGRDKQNAMIAEYNVKLRQFAAENGCQFIDLAYYVSDHYGRMPKIYSMDHYHLNTVGCTEWMRILRFYEQYESEGGVLQ